MLLTQLCLTLCAPIDSGPPGSSVHEISQARILKWVAIIEGRIANFHLFKVSKFSKKSTKGCASTKWKKKIKNEKIWIQECQKKRGEGNSWKDGEGPSRNGSCVYIWRATHQIWAETAPQSAVNAKSPANPRTEHLGGCPGLWTRPGFSGPYTGWALALCPCLGAWRSWEHRCRPQLRSALTWSLSWTRTMPFIATHSLNSGPSPCLVLGPNLCCQTSCVLSELYVLRTHLWPCPVASPKGALVQSQGGWSHITIIPWRLSSAWLLLWVSIHQGHMQVCAAARFPKLSLLFGSSCIGEPTFMLNCSVMSNSCDPMDYRLPGFSFQGIFQARILEWAAISSSRGSSPPSDWTCIYCVSCIIGEFSTHWASVEAEPSGSTGERPTKKYPGELLTQKVG